MNLVNLGAVGKKMALNNLLPEIVDREKRIEFAVMLSIIFPLSIFTVIDGVPCYKVSCKNNTIIMEYDWYKNLVYISSGVESKSYKLRPIYRKDNQKLIDLASWVKLTNVGLMEKENGWQDTIV